MDPRTHKFDSVKFFSTYYAEECHNSGPKNGVTSGLQTTIKKSTANNIKKKKKEQINNKTLTNDNTGNNKSDSVAAA